MTDMSKFIASLPKAELHLHIEGTLEPGMMFELADRNGYDLPFQSLREVEAAYRFADLQSFLDIYYQGAAVLQTEQDFYDLMRAYLDRAAADGVRHAEVFFDPQSHTERGVGFGVFMKGFRAAMADMPDISSSLILCFLRHLSGADAVETMAMAEPHLEGVVAVGLDSSEKGNPPELFEEAYSMARELGLRAVAHAGEEGPPEYVEAALDVLGVERIDHGVRSLEKPSLVERLRNEQVPLTVCPLSNVALRVVDRLEDHPLAEMMSLGLQVSVNSDDPAYFGGYIGENYLGVAEKLDLGRDDLAKIARNSINSSFAEALRKAELITQLESALSADQG